MRSWRNWKRTAADLLALPPDTLLNLSRVTCVGGEDVVVENVVGLLHVGEDRVELELENHSLVILGSAFVVTLVTQREVHIKGTVENISYVKAKGVHP